MSQLQPRWSFLGRNVVLQKHHHDLRLTTTFRVGGTWTVKGKGMEGVGLPSLTTISIIFTEGGKGLLVELKNCLNFKCPSGQVI